MPFFRSIIAILAYSLATAPALAVSPGEQVDKVEKSLGVVEQAARSDRHVMGAGLLMLGAASGTAAVFANQSGNPKLKTDGPLIFGVLGGVFSLGGFLTLVLKREYETLPTKFRTMPERSPADLKAKAQAGEEFLIKLAARGKSERLWSSYAATGLGAGFLTWYAINPEYLGGATLYISGFCFFVGIAGFISESPAELELAKFQGGEEEIDLSWGIGPLPGGAVFQTALRF